MAIPASELVKNPFLRLLILGVPKCGKTSVAILTSPKPVRVILCEDPSAVYYAASVKPDFDIVEVTSGFNAMQAAISEAKKDIEAGKLKTLIVDPFSDFAEKLCNDCLDATDQGKGPDGRRAYPEYSKRLFHILARLFTLKCHVICMSHYMNTGGEVSENQVAKTGEGIIPLIPGSPREKLAGKFHDVIWMEIRQKQRIFVTGPEGRWGPGCRNIDGTKILPADVSQLIKAFKNRGKDLAAPMVEEAKPNGVATKPVRTPPAPNMHERGGIRR